MTGFFAIALVAFLGIGDATPDVEPLFWLAFQMTVVNIVQTFTRPRADALAARICVYSQYVLGGVMLLLLYALRATWPSSRQLEILGQFASTATLLNDMYALVLLIS